MGRSKKKIQLSKAEEEKLGKLVKKGKHSVRKIKRALILLMLQKGKKHSEIAEAVGVSLATVYNINDRFVKVRLDALEDKPRPGFPRKVTEEVEYVVGRIACSQIPAGKVRWTVALIKDKIVELGYELNNESVRQILKKAGIRLC